MMRAILAIVLAAGVLWGGYWFVGSAALETQVNGWLDAEAASGLEIARETVTVAGFPNRFDVTVTAPEFRDPATGWGWSAPALKVYSMTWKPWHLIAALPAQQRITAPDGTVWTLGSQRLRGSLLMKPGLDLALDQTVAEGEALSLTPAEGGAWSADKLVVAAAQDPTRVNGLRLGVQATRILPDPTRLARVADLGPEIADAHLDAVLELTAPIDRHLAEIPPEVVALHLAETHLTWGPLVVSAKGDLTKGGAGRAEGQIALSVDHWQRLPDALVALGLLPSEGHDLALRALTLLAEGASNPDRLEVPLVMKDGWMSLGALPLGPAPAMP